MQSKIIFALVATLVAAATAVPTAQEAEAPPLEKRGCPSNTLHHFQGGGCRHNWRNICHNQCIGKSTTQHCCPGTLTSKISGSGCAWGWSTCECACTR
jgi:hypothetical protein